jgi:hypothetical protein
MQHHGRVSPPEDDQPAPTDPAPGRPGRPTTVVGAVLAVLVLVGLVVAVVASRQEPADQSPGTPEAVVQAYFRALADGSTAGMRATFTPELASRCTTMGMQYRPQVSRVALAGTTLDGGTALVRVAVTERFDGNVLGNDESTFDQEINLTNTAEGWRISVDPWPYLCNGKVAP